MSEYLPEHRVGMTRAKIHLTLADKAKPIGRIVATMKQEMTPLVGGVLKNISTM